MPKLEKFNRELVLKQATHVFHNKGYNAASMQDLVDATGLNRSSIYNSFGSKLDLFFDCLKQYQLQYQVTISKIITNSECPMRAIQDIFELFLNEIVNDEDHKGCLITNCTSELGNNTTSVISFLNANHEGMLSLFKDLVSRAQAKQEINNNKSAEAYALYLFSALQGFRMTGILVHDKKQLRSIVDTILLNLN